MDLFELGKILEQRRKVIGTSRAEIARRVGVSPSYVWMIENAKPRKEREPSQPSPDVLLRWAKALGWEEVYAKQLLSLAGHGSQKEQDGAAAMPVSLSDPSTLSFPQPKRLERERLLQEVADLLDQAERLDAPWQETVGLLRSFVSFLSCRLGFPTRQER